MDDYDDNLNDLIEKTEELYENISELNNASKKFTLAKEISQQLHEELIKLQ